MSSLSEICKELIKEGVPKKELSQIADDCEMLDYPGSLGDKYEKAIIIALMGAAGAYIGHKINSPSYAPEIFGGMFGILFGTYGCAHSDQATSPHAFLDEINKKYPEQLRKIYKRNGLTDKEVDKIFGTNFKYEAQMHLFQ